MIGMFVLYNLCGSGLAVEPLGVLWKQQCSMSNTIPILRGQEGGHSAQIEGDRGRQVRSIELNKITV